jgi:alpha-L-fucosidase
MITSLAHAADPPKPYGVVPTDRQVRWHELETYGFCHFTVNTFTDREWGEGSEKESVFNPTDFDADQIVAAFKAGGLKGLILTCKHHDGFCLWPSKFTEHCVKNSPWKNGKGDVVKELSEACKKQGLLFGMYLSPWDRNSANYARPEYITYYRNQVRELIENYGQPFIFWFDGANGGSGYYGGDPGTRHIDATTYYDWKNTWALIRNLAPNAVMFSDVGPDVRWCGNESGHVPYPSWSTITLVGKDGKPPAPGVLDDSNLGTGTRNGTAWIGAEVDVSIRPGWFWHADQKPRTPANLVKLFYDSVGHGASLNLNVPPDNRGRIADADIASLKEYRRILDQTFAVNLARSAAITASNTRGNDPAFAPSQMLDGSKSTYWATDDDVHRPEFTLVWQHPVTFNVIDLREYLPLGQRVDGFAVQIMADGKWTEYARGSSIGNRCLIRGSSVTTDQVRVQITGCPVCPAISEFGLYAEPVKAEAAEVARGRVGISKAKWKVVSTSYTNPQSDAKNAIDDDPSTIWHTYGPDGEHHLPQNIVVDMGETVEVKAFTYLPRQDGTPHGMVDGYEFYLSEDGKTWGEPASKGEFANVKNNPILQTVALPRPTRARYFKFVATHAVELDHAAIAELGIVSQF